MQHCCHLPALPTPTLAPCPTNILTRRSNSRPALMCWGEKERRFAPLAQWAIEHMANLEVVKLQAGHGVNMEASAASMMLLLSLSARSKLRLITMLQRPTPRPQPLRPRCPTFCARQFGKMLAKAADLAVDGIVLDLEDAVAPNAKAQAREFVIDALNNLQWRQK